MNSRYFYQIQRSSGVKISSQNPWKHSVTVTCNYRVWNVTLYVFSFTRFWILSKVLVKLFWWLPVFGQNIIIDLGHYVIGACGMRIMCGRIVCHYVVFRFQYSISEQTSTLNTLFIARLLIIKFTLFSNIISCVFFLYSFVVDFSLILKV